MGNVGSEQTYNILYKGVAVNQFGTDVPLEWYYGIEV